MDSEKRYREITGILFFLLALLILLSLFSFAKTDLENFLATKDTVNLIGPFGVFISHGLRYTIGLSAFLIPILLASIGFIVFNGNTNISILENIGAYTLIIIAAASFFPIIMETDSFHSGGIVGTSINFLLTDLVGSLGSILIIIIFNIISLIFMGVFSLSGLQNKEKDFEMSRILEKVKSVLHITKRNADYPQNSIEEAINAKEKKMPWITKKRIVVYETEKLESNIQDSIKYLEMNNNPIDKESLLEDKTPPKDEYADIFSITDEREDSENQEEDIELSENTIPDEEDKEEVKSIEKNRIKSIDIEIENINKEEIIDCEIQNNVSEKEEPKETKSCFEEISINDEYIIPISYLSSTKPINTENWKIEVKKNSMLLVNTLGEFGIESKVINVNRGPVITLYEMQIAPGIKVNRIVGLSDDIALALAASRVRIVAPIPGKSAIGIEIPNKERELVTLGDIIKTNEYKNHHGNLKVGLGKDILGKPIMLDLKKLPHLLIAGATGSGKSVCVNSIITSLIYNYDPNYVRFILVDPKMVELQLYDGLPHLLTPVIIDPMLVPSALKWIMYEMERRYRLLSDINTRDIIRYNERITEENLGLEQLPFIVTIIDELADLMMVASKEIEGYITRIAQKARAVGIHLVLATQRPSVDIITGIIKANIPARIAFQVAQKTDSRTIIDQNGAEKLLGKGDLLYQSPVSSFPTRIQGALISEEETLKIVEHCKTMGKPQYINIEESLFEEDSAKEIDNNGDELFVEALKIIEETKKASASYLQRRLSIGYNRAARIIEQMEDLGYVGPQQGSKPREVFI